jgi:hydrogenase maturation protease
VVPEPGRAEAPDLAHAAIRHAAYEEGRPSEEVAYRHGDARFVPGQGR